MIFSPCYATFFVLALKYLKNKQLIFPRENTYKLPVKVAYFTAPSEILSTANRPKTNPNLIFCYIKMYNDFDKGWTMDWESESDVGEDSENNITSWESKFVPDPLSQGNYINVRWVMEGVKIS